MKFPAAALDLKPDMDRAVERWLAFWNHDLIGRPLCRICAPKDSRAPAARPPYMAGADGDLQAAARMALAHAETVFWGGEAMPSYTPSFGPDMFAAWLGAPLHFPAAETGTSWAQACIEEWESALPLKLDEQCVWWTRMLEFCRVLAREFRGRMIVAHLDLHSNLDALLAMRGGERLCVDLIENPEAIDRAMADVRALYRPIYQALYDAAEMNGTGTCGWVPAYHPIRTNTIQCDFAALIGPEHFRRWALPALEEEAAFLGHCVYHLDGPECLVHLDDLCRIPGLDCIQWVHGARNRPFIEWMDLLKRIQSKGVSVWVPCDTASIRVYHRELRPEMVFYDCAAASESDARATLDWLDQNN